MIKSTENLNENEALVLQQVHEDGEDDTRSLAEQLKMSRHHVLTIIASLKHKGLIAVNNDIDGLWISLTQKGNRLMRMLWPEARSIFA